MTEQAPKDCRDVRARATEIIGTMLIAAKKMPRDTAFMFKTGRRVYKYSGMLDSNNNLIC